MSTATEVKERPILFGPPMVNAIIAGKKSQTRRIVKGAPRDDQEPQYPFRRMELIDGYPYFCCRSRSDEFGVYTGHATRCPYGAPGDQLWVKEGFEVNDDGMFYTADGAEIEPVVGAVWEGRAGRKPSIHMPRWASRITLEVTGVRVERLHQISDADVIAEGVEEQHIEKYRKFFHKNDVHALAYGELWDSINGKGSWAANPWVWVVSFHPGPQEAK